MSEWLETVKEMFRGDRRVEEPDAPILREAEQAPQAHELHHYFELEPVVSTPFQIEKKSPEEQAEFLAELEQGYDHLRAAITRDFGLPMPSWETFKKDKNRQESKMVELEGLGDWGEKAATRLNVYLSTNEWVADRLAAAEVRQDIPDSNGKAA